MVEREDAAVADDLATVRLILALRAERVAFDDAWPIAFPTRPLTRLELRMMLSGTTSVGTEG